MAGVFVTPLSGGLGCSGRIALLIVPSIYTMLFIFLLQSLSHVPLPDLLSFPDIWMLSLVDLYGCFPRIASSWSSLDLLMVGGVQSLIDSLSLQHPLSGFSTSLITLPFFSLDVSESTKSSANNIAHCVSSWVSSVMSRIRINRKGISTRGGAGIWPGPGPRVLKHQVGTESFRVLAQTKDGYREKYDFVLFWMVTVVWQ